MSGAQAAAERADLNAVARFVLRSDLAGYSKP